MSATQHSETRPGMFWEDSMEVARLIRWMGETDRISTIADAASVVESPQHYIADWVLMGRDPEWSTVCPECHGGGEVTVNLSSDPQEAYESPCPSCRGTGVRS